MKTLILVMSSLFIMGCHQDRIVINTPSQCPTFDAKLNIMVTEHSNHVALLSWDDVGKLERFLEQKKVFNEGVKEINNGTE